MTAALRAVTFSDCLTVRFEQMLISGIQALVRLMSRRPDRIAVLALALVVRGSAHVRKRALARLAVALRACSSGSDQSSTTDAAMAQVEAG